MKSDGVRARTDLEALGQGIHGQGMTSGRVWQYRSSPVPTTAGASSAMRQRRPDERCMDIVDEREAYERLVQLRQEHRDLDHAITGLGEALFHDELRLKRMKKRKLLIKDQIERLESRLIPDLDA